MYLLRGIGVIVSTVGFMTVMSPIFWPETTSPGYTVPGVVMLLGGAAAFVLPGMSKGCPVGSAGSRAVPVHSSAALRAATLAQIYRDEFAHSTARWLALASVRVPEIRASAGTRGGGGLPRSEAR